jgi:hypothetical protein
MMTPLQEGWRTYITNADQGKSIIVTVGRNWISVREGGRMENVVAGACRQFESVMARVLVRGGTLVGRSSGSSLTTMKGVHRRKVSQLKKHGEE